MHKEIAARPDVDTICPALLHPAQQVKRLSNSTSSCILRCDHNGGEIKIKECLLIPGINAKAYVKIMYLDTDCVLITDEHGV